MFPNSTPLNISLSPAITIHGIQSGSGPPLLLLHGFPQNHKIWHLIAPHLTPTYTIIALDLRGYGQSSKPAGGDDHSAYSKSVMADDCIAVMSKLGHDRFYICAHDRGARVAHKLCVNYPERVWKAVFLDIAPTLAMYTRTDFAFARAYWHWFFLIQPAPLPESLMLANPRGWIENTMGRRTGGMEVFHKEAVESYVRQMGDGECVAAMCEDYRAAAGVDLEESREDVERGKKIRCPVRVLWGKKGVIEAQFDALKEWREVAEEGMVNGESVDSGHYIPEENPDVVLKHIKEFLRD